MPPIEINRVFNNPGDRKSIVECCVNRDMFACRGSKLNPDSKTCDDALASICNKDLSINEEALSHVCNLREDEGDKGCNSTTTPEEDGDGNLNGIKMPVRLNKKDVDLIELHTQSVTGSSSGSSDNTIRNTIIVIVVCIVVFFGIPFLWNLFKNKKSSSTVNIDTGAGEFPI